MSLRRDGTRLKRSICASAAVVLALTLGTSGQAEEPGHDGYAQLAVVPDTELREIRGGMTVMGVDFSFGAIHTVLVDGTPVSRTSFTLDGDALVRTLEFLDSSRAQEFNGSNSPAGINLGALSDLKGVVVTNGNGGGSVALSDIRPGAFEAALLNSAANQDIRHRFDIMLVINNFSQLQSDLSAAKGAATIASTLNDVPGF